MISAIVTCFTAGWVLALEQVLPDWNGDYVIWVAGLVSSRP